MSRFAGALILVLALLGVYVVLRQDPSPGPSQVQETPSVPPAQGDEPARTAPEIDRTPSPGPSDGSTTEGQAPFDPGFALPKGIVPLAGRGGLPEAIERELTANMASARDELMSKALRMCSDPDSTTAEDVQRQYDMILAADQRQLAIAQMQRDEYLLFPSGGTVDRVIPPAGFLAMRLYNAGTLHGVSCDALFCARYDDPGVAEAVAACMSIREVVRDTQAEIFNALPYAERRARIEAHYEAMAALVALRDLSLDPAEKAMRAKAIGAKILSGNFRIDRTNYLVERPKD